MSYDLAVDLGGTHFRPALVDISGDIVQSSFVDSPRGTADQPGWDEIDADEWWRGLQSLADALAIKAGAAFDAVEAIAICGVTRTQIFVDEHGAAIRPA